MTQPNRIAWDGLQIDRRRALSFRFNGKTYQGYEGDTLASALLANGVHLVGRSFKYHRPRGILSAGVEEPNALVELGREGAHQPNLRATEIPLFDGLEARSQNCWPSLKWDLGAAVQLASPMLTAGFYYKTFMQPSWAWRHYEKVIRKAAGLGKAPTVRDEARYDKRHQYCDLLVVGAGPAGLMAATSAARRSARVILVDERRELGGMLLEESVHIAGQTAKQWVQQTLAELEALETVTVLPRTTVFGRYRHGKFGLVQHTEQGQVLHSVHARRAVMATGAIERPMVFSDNDRPGVMLAGAIRRYIRCYGVVPGRRAAIFTNNDSAYETARCLREAGAEVAAIVDLRERAPSVAGLDDVEILTQAEVVGVQGSQHVKAVEIEVGSKRRRIACDLLCVSGGWTPTIHLLAHGGKDTLAYDAAWGAFIPTCSEPVPGIHATGACNGAQSLVNILAQGIAAGEAAAEALGCEAATPVALPEVQHRGGELSPSAAPVCEVRGGRGKKFVDLQDDVTVRDLELALREGYRSIEHVKRYTTLGMGTDQGRTSNINGMRIVAERLGKRIDEVGTTTFRPPFTPVSLGALAGRESDRRLDVLRRSPIHDWHVRNGAVFMPSGLWLRPQYYRRPGHGETLTEAARKEAANVRDKVGIADVSTLGKIEVQGRDAAEFLNRLYINRCGNVGLHKARYGVMLREDGFVFDDGTVVKLADNRYLISTTTVNAGAVLSHMEFHQQMVWPELSVHIEPVTEQWAVVALAGPASREVLARLMPEEDVSNQALPFLGYREVCFQGVTTRLFRISFSGELAYEIAVPADHGLTLWEALLEAGEPFGIMPYGLEAMDYLRIEKGHLIIGTDIDGRVTPHDIGLGGMIRGDDDFIGRRSLQRPALTEEGRPRLVGFVSADGETPIPASAQLVAERWTGTPQDSLGRITSPGFSPVLDCPIALGLAEVEAEGGSLYAVSPLTGEQAEVTVTRPVFHDPKGERLRG
ncbi:sarcosine oxidase subunit alpha [Litchfieldella qijiaojingensis]|uniref:Sarcosine oxidase subunit alpha n=1 Tax=Litchfieldella qijiaojingensis TaxID=980347 RepID=A0ABQ2YKL1_9GAMM|nr:sarcosine oxidase subunit alpha family protein [Halomonas qijiaojingensis]GGX87493.1 sarcosine oxidase subunit alpha [Halomonas qijiaojingensis]